MSIKLIKVKFSLTPCHIVQVSNNAAVDDVVGIIEVTDPDNYKMDPPVQSHNCSVGGEGLNVFIVDNEAMNLKVCCCVMIYFSY